MNTTEISDIRAAIAELVAYNKELAQQRAEEQRLRAEEQRLRAEERQQRAEEQRRRDIADEKRQVEIELMRKDTKRTDDLLKKQMGELGNSFGSYTEALIQPSARKIVEEVFGAEVLGNNIWSDKNKQYVEYDVLGYSNSKNNVVVIVEIKSSAKK